jgi:hypothetical protein
VNFDREGLLIGETQFSKPSRDRSAEETMARRLLIIACIFLDRPEIERDYDAMMPMIADAFTPYYAAMVDSAATVYASNFTAGDSAR